MYINELQVWSSWDVLFIYGTLYFAPKAPATVDDSLHMKQYAFLPNHLYTLLQYSNITYCLCMQLKLTQMLTDDLIKQQCALAMWILLCVWVETN